MLCVALCFVHVRPNIELLNMLVIFVLRVLLPLGSPTPHNNHSDKDSSLFQWGDGLIDNVRKRYDLGGLCSLLHWNTICLSPVINVSFLQSVVPLKLQFSLEFKYSVVIAHVNIIFCVTDSAAWLCIPQQPQEKGNPKAKPNWRSFWRNPLWAKCSRISCTRWTR